MRKILAIIFVFACGEVSLYGDNWIPFTKDSPAEEIIEVLDMSTQFVSLKTGMPGVYSRTVDTKNMTNTQNEIFVLLYNYKTKYDEIGKPRLPAIYGSIEYPWGAELTIEIIDTAFEEISLSDLGIQHRIVPALPPVLQMRGARPVFVINTAYYAQDKFLPSELVQIIDTSQDAAHKVALMEILPIQYNAKSGKIRYYTNIEFRITFVNGDVQRTREEIGKRYFPASEDLLKYLILNYGCFEQSPTPR